MGQPNPSTTLISSTGVARWQPISHLTSTYEHYRTLTGSHILQIDWWYWRYPGVLQSLNISIYSGSTSPTVVAGRRVFSDQYSSQYRSHFSVTSSDLHLNILDLIMLNILSERKHKVTHSTKNVLRTFTSYSRPNKPVILINSVAVE